jgi:hypothetical protein
MKCLPKDIPNKLKKVKRFFFASKKSGYTLKLFIDSVRISDEAVKKFMSRREASIRTEKITMISGAETLLMDSFKTLGVDVVFSVDSDNDDALACHANQDEASILSSDNDYFRYHDTTYEIYSEFEISQDGNLILKGAVQNMKRQISKRALISPPPALQRTHRSLIRYAYGVLML